MTDRISTPIGAALLALSGLGAPLSLAVLIALSPSDATPPLIAALIAYSGVVQGFTGGVRWGAELVRAPDKPNLVRLAAAGLITAPAWCGVLLVTPPLWLPAQAMALLAVTGFAQLAWDVSAARAGLLPGWTVQLRVVLTVLAVACLGFSALRLM